MKEPLPNRRAIILTISVFPSPPHHTIRSPQPRRFSPTGGLPSHTGGLHEKDIGKCH